jgi:WD40 repeat protein
LNPVLNEGLKAGANLLKTIPLGEICPGRIRFYAQDQVAGTGDNGLVFVLTSLDNRIFATTVDGVSDFALLGRTFFLAAPERGFFSLSFERNEICAVHSAAMPPFRLASFPPDRVISAHQDGTIRVWDFLEKTVWALAGARTAPSSLAVDQSGRIYAGYGDGGLMRWDLETRKGTRVEGIAAAVRFLRISPGAKILAVEQGAEPTHHPVFRTIDLGAGTMATLSTPFTGQVSGVNVYFDGRITVALGASKVRSGLSSGSLVVISPREDSCAFTALSGHAHRTKDCLTMGPKIVTCGEEDPGNSSVRIWGSEFYVRTELGKLLINP